MCIPYRKDGEGGPGILSRSVLTNSPRKSFHRNHVVLHMTRAWRMRETIVTRTMSQKPLGRWLVLDEN